MTITKLNFTIPKDIADNLRSRIGKRKRSAFIAEAIRQKLRELEERELREALEEGYQARRKEDAEINKEWETATMEGWL